MARIPRNEVAAQILPVSQRDDNQAAVFFSQIDDPLEHRKSVWWLPVNNRGQRHAWRLKEPI